MLSYTTRIVIVKPGRTSDRYSDDILDWTPEAVTRIEVERGVSLQPTSQAEGNDRRTLLTSGWLLATPAGMDLPLEAVDRIEFGGRTVEVTGEVARFPHPIIRGGVHHVEAQLTAVTG
ncbi:head closure Hc1 [Gordonia phage Catfish]|uniref:Head-to-tail connector complex protein n=1 Tax=Gordonia phage Catfish TaxID=2301538 RepID=A0A385D1C5_9CAUD|nr:head closure Hc1 [Gordonia phage Catfish]AXQ51849.1 head-to-tail connector complex protein [Gordonia phage Catfish]